MRDTQQDTTTVVSRASGAAGAGADSNSSFASISTDGRFVAFQSNAENLSAGDTALTDIFVRDVLGPPPPPPLPQGLPPAGRRAHRARPASEHLVPRGRGGRAAATPA